MSDIKVELIGCTQDPQLLSVAGALGCFEEKSSMQLMEELNALPEDQRGDLRDEPVLHRHGGKALGSP